MIKLVEYNSISRWSCKKYLCQRAKDRKKRIFSLCFERLEKFKRVRKLFKLEDEEIGFTFKEKKEKRNQSDKQSTAKFSPITKYYWKMRGSLELGLLFQK